MVADTFLLHLSRNINNNSIQCIINMNLTSSTTSRSENDYGDYVESIGSMFQWTIRSHLMTSEIHSDMRMLLSEVAITQSEKNLFVTNIGNFLLYR